MVATKPRPHVDPVTRARNAQTAAEAAERRAQIWELYKVGTSARAIARVMDLSPSTVLGAIKRVVQEYDRQAMHSAKILKRVQLEQYRDWLMNMQRLLRAGDPAAVRAAVRVNQEIAKLFGLYAPELVDFGPEAQKIAREMGIDLETVVNVFRQLLAEET